MKSFWPAKFSKQDKNDIPGGWPNEAVQIEEMVEELRKVSGDLNKRISTYIPSQGVPDPDKRLKKIPEFNIVTAFTQSANRFEGCKPELGCVFDSIGKASNELAICRRDLEKDLEESVITHLKKLVDDEIPTIQKDRKHLSKYCNELKTANERLRSSDNTIQTANSSSSNTQAAIAKHQQFRAAQEEAEQRAYQQKDHTLKAFFQFDSRTRENASKMLEYLELHARYHQECASILQTWIPQIKSQIVEHLVSPVFRTPMIIHLNETNREISYVLDICIKALNKEDALKEEGIFRTAGSKTKVDTLTHALDAMRANSLIFECEYSVVADALKQYFRFMEEPLLMSSLYDEWMNAMQMQSHNDRLQSLWTVCHKLPKGNMDNLRYLIKFLAKVSTYSEHNKMTPSNLGIVFGPNLLKSGKLNDTDPIGMMSTGVQSQIVEIMINHADWFFPGEMFTAFSEDLSPKNETPSRTFVVSSSAGAYVNPVTNAAAIDAAAAMPNNHSADIDGDKLSVERPSTPKPSRHSPVSASFSPGGSLPRKPQRKNPAPQPPGSRPLAATSSSDEGNYTKSMPSVLHVAPAPSSMSTNSSNHQTISVNTDSGTAQMKNRPSSIRARPLKSSTLPPPRPTSMPPEPLSESRPSRPPRPSHAPPAIPRSSLPSGEALAESDMRKGSLESEDPYDDLDSPTEPENTYL